MEELLDSTKPWKCVVCKGRCSSTQTSEQDKPGIGFGSVPTIKATIEDLDNSFVEFVGYLETLPSIQASGCVLVTGPPGWSPSKLQPAGEFSKKINDDIEIQVPVIQNIRPAVVRWPYKMGSPPLTTTQLMRKRNNSSTQVTRKRTHSSTQVRKGVRKRLHSPKANGCSPRKNHSRNSDSHVNQNNGSNTNGTASNHTEISRSNGPIMNGTILPVNHVEPNKNGAIKNEIGVNNTSHNDSTKNGWSYSVSNPKGAARGSTGPCRNDACQNGVCKFNPAKCQSISVCDWDLIAFLDKRRAAGLTVTAWCLQSNMQVGWKRSKRILNRYNNMMKNNSSSWKSTHTPTPSSSSTTGTNRNPISSTSGCILAGRPIPTPVSNGRKRLKPNPPTTSRPTSSAVPLSNSSSHHSSPSRCSESIRKPLPSKQHRSPLSKTSPTDRRISQSRTRRAAKKPARFADTVSMRSQFVCDFLFSEPKNESDLPADDPGGTVTMDDQRCGVAEDASGGEISRRGVAKVFFSEGACSVRLGAFRARAVELDARVSSLSLAEKERVFWAWVDAHVQGEEVDDGRVSPKLRELLSMKLRKGPEDENTDSSNSPVDPDAIGSLFASIGASKLSATGRYALYAIRENASLWDPGSAWNPGDMENWLDALPHNAAGITTTYIYFGEFLTSFPWHIEDAKLFSVNYLHFGAPKMWYMIPPSHSDKFRAVLEGVYADEYTQCTRYDIHKQIILNPQLLVHMDPPIPVLFGVQQPNQFMIIWPDTYHAGFNTGFNCAESVNFATPSWQEAGRQAEARWSQCCCMCALDGTRFHIDMESFRTEVDQWEERGRTKLPDRPFKFSKVDAETQAKVYEKNEAAPRKLLDYQSKTVERVHELVESGNIRRYGIIGMMYRIKTNYFKNVKKFFWATLMEHAPSDHSVTSPDDVVLYKFRYAGSQWAPESKWDVCSWAEVDWAHFRLAGCGAQVWRSSPEDIPGGQPAEPKLKKGGKKRGRPRGSKTQKVEDDQNFVPSVPSTNGVAKRKVGRPRGSGRKKVVKEEKYFSDSEIENHSDSTHTFSNGLVRRPIGLPPAQKGRTPNQNAPTSSPKRGYTMPGPTSHTMLEPTGHTGPGPNHHTMSGPTSHTMPGVTRHTMSGPTHHIMPGPTRLQKELSILMNEAEDFVYNGGGLDSDDEVGGLSPGRPKRVRNAPAKFMDCVEFALDSEED
eukprot:78466_1